MINLIGLGVASQAVNVPKKHYKYLHIFPAELKFSSPFIEAIQNKENGLEAEEHFFVVHSRSIYDSLKQIEKYGNIALYESEREKQPVHEIIDKYGDCCDWIFLHSLGDPRNIHKIKRKYFKKIIWRTWGHDTQVKDNLGRFYMKFIKRLYNKYYIPYFARSIHAIGVANYVDEISLQRAGLNNTILPLNYFPLGDRQFEQSTAPNVIENGVLNITVGHSAYPEECYEEIIDLLSKFRNEKIKVYFMLSYGSEAVRNKAREYAYEKLGRDKVEIMDKFMPYNEYYNFLSKMNISILAGKKSYALGNIGILLYEGKTLYLRENGILDEAFTKKQIPHHHIEELQTMDFNSFSDLCVDVRNTLNKARSTEDRVKVWKDFLSGLND